VDQTSQSHQLTGKHFPKARKFAQSIVARSSSSSRKHSDSSCWITSKSLSQQIEDDEIESICLVFHQTLPPPPELVEVYSSISSVDQIVSAESSELESVSKKVIGKYRDVFPDELPPGLPPQREIDHKIDLVPGSSPTSRPTYRMSLSQ